MKRTALLTAVMLCVTTMAYAHCGNCPMDKQKSSEGFCEKKMEKMTERLSLTEEQVAQINPLVKEKVEKKKAIMKEAREKKEAIKEEYSGKIKDLLNDEQKVKFDEWKAEMKAEKGAKKGHKKHAHGPDCKCKLCLLEKK